MTSIKPREPSPKKFGGPVKDSYNKSRVPYDSKREPPYAEKRGRDYEITRVAPIARPGSGPSGSAGKYEGRPYDSRDSRGEPRGRELPPSRPKDSRYMDRERERDRSPHFRPSVREERERRPISEKPDMSISSREHRYGESNGKGKDNIIKFNISYHQIFFATVLCLLKSKVQMQKI
ncbi:hypothetical protein NQ314_020642 [Rhamnusium bicolor]|uniref:Uncharacterized protein n=1 Tax=Rhamnusium bicolor TaxID=1586634 RepID=A0AAV8WKN8_9CUCU|nr:hypothetical protein NQ314_020642 [Rhamnusium bicolor]